uniref:Uncharacterized protein LOC114329834 n=1 Tax=Diabrotica virgifera virgifera TaxID=50390 RepID=A0A6P7FIT9_DIAVI
MKMEALKSSYAQNVVEHEISNILFQASIGKYDYPATGQMTPISTHSSSSSFPIHPPLSSPQYVSSPSPQYIPQVTESQTVPELRSPQYALPSSSQYIPQQTQDIPLTDSQTEQETSLAASSILLEAINTANILD